MAFTLELLHFSDQEGTTSAIQDAPRLSAVLNALRAQDIGGDGLPDYSITLSSGDAFIPGVFYSASRAAFGSGGIADIQIQNELGVQAIAFGNHEFDFGTGQIAGLISGNAPGSLFGVDFTGTDFPYLSTNLDFSTDPNLAPLEVAGGGAPQGNVVTSSTIISLPTIGGGPDEKIGVIGATTPTLDVISSPGSVGISPDPFGTTPSPAELDALAATIQAEVDALLAANPDMNKVVLLAHMQQIGIEFALATRLTNVDVIVAGGSNTRLFDDNDRMRAGDSDQGEYPQFFTNAGGTTTAVVNTDGSYKYVGRLVIDFDDAGNLLPGSYDPTVSGAYATDDQGVADLGAAGLVDPEIQAIVDALEAQIIATESNVFGISNVFLNGNRSGTGSPDDPDGVRTQETNLGNLTADANLAAAQEADSTVVVSIKNGGGIRASIGQTIVPPGETSAVRLANEELLDSAGNVIKPAGGISQNDIATSLAFNNGLTLLTLTRAELVAVLEHGIRALPAAAGQFIQVSGVVFSYDETRPAGSRIIDASIVDDTGAPIATLVENGKLAGDPATTFRIVTLNFLASGGDGYPFPAGASANRVDLAQTGVRTGDALFADDGTEQDALAEFLFDNHNTPATAYNVADVGPDADQRIENLAFAAPLTLGDPRQGGRGDDYVAGTNGDDFLYGDRGNDTLSGNDGDDVLFGGQFHDEIHAGAGDDIAYGGVGRDTIFGDDGDDVLNGEGSEDVIDGGIGNDVILGGFGSDTITGGIGNDTINGERDRDVIDGGTGDDAILGESGGDTLTGGDGNDWIDGGIDNDVIDGGIGNDTLLGDRGRDALDGGAGDDLLEGGIGNDTLDGGPGTDILTGGLGADEFVFAAGAAPTLATITDFGVGKDLIHLSGFGLTDAASALAFGADVGGDAVFTFAVDTVLVVENRTLASFSDADFFFS